KTTSASSDLNSAKQCSSSIYSGYSVNELNPFQNHARYPNCLLTDPRFTTEIYGNSTNSFSDPKYLAKNLHLQVLCKISCRKNNVLFHINQSRFFLFLIR